MPERENTSLTRNGRATAITLDVTSDSEIQRAVDSVNTLDLLTDNARISIQDDLSNQGMIEQHLAVNCLGLFKVTRAFFPLRMQSKATIVNILSLASIASVLFSPAYYHFEGGGVQCYVVNADAFGGPRDDGARRLPRPPRSRTTRDLNLPTETESRPPSLVCRSC